MGPNESVSVRVDGVLSVAVMTASVAAGPREAMAHDERVETGLPVGVGCEIRAGPDGQQFDQAIAGAIYAALHGADGAITDARSLLVRHAGCADEDQRLALVCRQLLQRVAEVEK